MDGYQVIFMNLLSQVIPIAQDFSCAIRDQFHHLGLRFLICKMGVIMMSIVKVVLIHIKFLE